VSHDPDAAEDEVVAVLDDEAAARPVVEALLLAGLGPSTRPGPDGTVEVTVVAGQGPRAVEVLAAPDPDPGPFADVLPEADGVRGPEWSSEPAGTAAREARRRAREVDGGEAPGPRYGIVRVLLLFAVAMVVIPALAFYISFKASGG
jgi:hypothetical protein